MSHKLIPHRDTVNSSPTSVGRGGDGFFLPDPVFLIFYIPQELLELQGICQLLLTGLHWILYHKIMFLKSKTHIYVLASTFQKNLYFSFKLLIDWSLFCTAWVLTEPIWQKYFNRNNVLPVKHHIFGQLVLVWF